VASAPSGGASSAAAVAVRTLCMLSGLSEGAVGRFGATAKAEASAASKVSPQVPKGGKDVQSDRRTR